MTKEDMQVAEPSIEEIDDVSDAGQDQADAVQSPVAQNNENAMIQETASKPQSRNEKKARKVLSKLNLKPIKGVSRVVLKRPKGILFVISQPEVFKSTVADSYVVFGEARIEDMSAAANAMSGAQNFKVDESITQPDTSADDVPELEEIEEDSGSVDESGLEKKDIELVMQNASVSRAKAVSALRNNNNDIVNAIMELSM